MIVVLLDEKNIYICSNIIVPIAYAAVVFMDLPSQLDVATVIKTNIINVYFANYKSLLPSLVFPSGIQYLFARLH